MICVHTQTECRHARYCALNEDDSEKRYAACMNAHALNGATVGCGQCRRGTDGRCAFLCFRAETERLSRPRSGRAGEGKNERAGAR